MMGVDGVLTRISELRNRLGIAPAPAATGGAGFASALTAARGTTGTSAPTGGPTGGDVVTAAKKYLGVPYRFGSTDPAKGLDCSALIQRAYADLGIEIPRTSAQQAKAGTRVDSLAAARPGDILAFNSPVDHVGIYVGGNRMIVAPHSGDHVKIQSVYEKPSQIRRMIAETPAAATAPTVTTAAAVRPSSLQNAGSLASVPYGDMFVRAGATYGVPAKLLAAVAKVESGYNPKAVSPAGAQGLMQLMPSTAKGLGVKNSFDPEQAINGAAKLLARNLKEFKTVPLALAAYNAGGAAVHKYGGIPPYSETQAYVPKVQKALAKLT